MSSASSPAGAQTVEAERNVDITFEVGNFDGARGDWPITIVHVSGALDEGQPFTVELKGADGSVLWSDTATFTAPTTSFAVVPFVAVGEVVEAGIAQAQPKPQPVVEGAQTERPPPSVTTPRTTTTPETPTTSPPEVAGEQTGQPPVVIDNQGAGGSGSGQLALSMVMSVVLVALLFRTPLPSATSQRWTK